jgi:hypothetical protein
MTCHRDRTTTGCTAVYETAVRHHNAAAGGRDSTAILSLEVGAALEGHAGNEDGRVGDVESGTEGDALSSAAVEYGGIWYTRDDE